MSEPTEIGKTREILGSLKAKYLADKMREAEAELGFEVSTSSVPQLLRVLKSDSEGTRLAAVKALSTLGPDAQAAIPVLIDLLTLPNLLEDSPLYDELIETLESIGPPSVPFILDLLSGDHAPKVPGVVVRMLEHGYSVDLPAEEFRPFLVDSESKAGLEAAAVLACLDENGEEGVEALLNVALNSSDPKLRDLSIDLLGMLLLYKSNERAADALLRIQMLAPELELFGNAGLALDEFEGRASMDTILFGLRNGAGLSFMAAFAPVELEPLLNALVDGDQASVKARTRELARALREQCFPFIVSAVQAGYMRPEDVSLAVPEFACESEALLPLIEGLLEEAKPKSVRELAKTISAILIGGFSVERLIGEERESDEERAYRAAPNDEEVASLLEEFRELLGKRDIGISPDPPSTNGAGQNT